MSTENVRINFDVNTSALNAAVRELNQADGATARLYAEMMRLDRINLNQIPASFRRIVSAVDSTTAGLSEADRASVEFYRDMVRAGNINLNEVPEQFRSIVGSVRQADQAVVSFADRLRTSMQSAGQSMQSIGGSMANVGQGMTQYVTRPIMDGFGFAIKSSMDFGKQISQTGSVANASGKDLAGLKDQAIDLGIKTKYSAMEVAQGQTELMKAGRTTKQVFAEMEDVLGLAAAGDLEVGRAAEISSNMMNMFSKEGVKSSQVANLMAGAANQSAIDVSEFYTSMQYVGPMAASLGIPLKDVSSVIAILGNNAIKGNKAGTGLRQFLTRLQPASKDAAAVMNQLGITTEDGGNKFYTSKGKVKSFAEMIDVLRSSTAGMTDQAKSDALKKMFGLIASPTLLTLMKEESSTIDDMSKRIGQISAAEVAAKKMDNLAGSVDILMSSLETLAILIGDAFAPVLRVFADILGVVANAILAIPSPILVAATVFLLLIAAIGPLLLMAGTLVGAIGGIVAGIGVLIPIAGTVAAVIGVVVAFFAQLAIVIGIAVVAVIAIVNTLIPLKDTFNLIKAVLTGNLTSAFDLLVNKFGMTKSAATALINGIESIKDRASQLWTVIKSNLGPVFSLLKENILNAVSGLLTFNTSTKETKGNAVGLFTGIISPIKSLIDYLYKTFDAFGLIPTKVKYAKDKTVLEFIELTASTKKSLDGLISASGEMVSNISQKNKMFADSFGNTEGAIKRNATAYKQMVDETKKALDSELKFVLEHAEKKKQLQIKSATEVFKESSVLSAAEEQDRIKKLTENFEKHKTALTENNNKIKEILTLASMEKRKLTTDELTQVDLLRKQSQNIEIQDLTGNKLKQKAILEEAKNLTMTISRQEALETITEANKTYDSVIVTARKTKADRIAEIVQMRDQSKIITADEARAMIGEANNTYTQTVGKARQTKNETVQLASEKASGTISHSDREKREITDQSDKIKAVVKKLWTDLKGEIPGIVGELVANILSSLAKGLVSGVTNIINDATNALARGLANMVGMGSSKSSSSSKKKNYTGNRYFEGGATLVGEYGAELVSLPKGSQIYNNNQTRSMFDNSSSKSAVINISGAVGTDQRNQLAYALRSAGVY